MAGYFELGFQTASPAAGAAFALFENTDAANGRPIRIIEIGFTTNAATLSSVGLARVPAANYGTVSGGAQNPLTSDGFDTTASKVSLFTAWSVQPTAPTAYFRQFVAAAVQGAGIPWSWPENRPFVIPPQFGALLWNFGAGAASILSGWIVCIE